MCYNSLTAMYKDLDRILETLAALVPEGSEAYVAGGTVRDILMGREPEDVDVVVSTDPGGFARSAAKGIGGSAFVMDEARGVYRVALKSGGVPRVDVSPLKGNIRQDLSARDFTINAMAAALAPAPAPSPAALIDPFGGLADLRAGVVRVLGKKAFADDPLRLLRAFRLSAALGFEIEEKTLSMVSGLAGEITRASPERVRDELYMILECPRSEEVIRRMRKHGLLLAVLPELSDMEGVEQGAPHAYGLLEHSLRALGRCEAVMSELPRYFGGNAARVDEYLQRAADGAVKIKTVLKLCALFHDSGKPSSMKVEDGRPRFFGHDERGALINEGLARRLMMSGMARDMLVKTAAMHMRPLNLSRGEPTARAVHRLVRDAGELLPALALVALSDALATREGPGGTVTYVEGAVRRLADYYYGGYAEAREQPLLKGGDLIEELGLAPGPIIGRILRDVEELRAEGLVGDRQDALGYVRENLERYLAG